MTTLLYIGFYAWLIGAIVFALILFAGVKLLGGREGFTEFFNKTQGKNYEVHHIDWALVISVVFWPQTIVTTIFNNIVTKAEKKPVENNSHLDN